MRNTKEIGERIRKLRIQRGVSQKDFADSIGLHAPQYNRYEKGETLPATETFAKLAEALGVSVDYLYEGAQEDAAIADFEDKELLQMFKEIENFSPETKGHIKATLNAYIKAERLQQLAG